jgi:hypothetical protein
MKFRFCILTSVEKLKLLPGLFQGGMTQQGKSPPLSHPRGVRFVEVFTSDLTFLIIDRGRACVKCQRVRDVNKPAEERWRR